ncbi:MAG: NAD(P)-dependent oxidoreductase [Lentisphaeria bacterium]|nr:NAD(P)-dependent oxidoreductase [Lentisphaeria bacterium]NQZ67718.1 NAD(P)-dependent oxidoreductase [Lentisphaeria bacterium]
MTDPRKILITGASGLIAGFAIKALKESCELTLVDLDDTAFVDCIALDLRIDSQTLDDLCSTHDMIIHLAFSKDHTDDIKMAENVYRAAMKADSKPSVIMASSIHAVGGYWDWQKEPYRSILNKQASAETLKNALIGIDRPLYPNSVYGASKGYLELLGKHYADQGLQVVVVRYGGVTHELDFFEKEPGFHSIWFSHGDTIHFFQCLVKAEITQQYSVIFATSKNRFGIHDLGPAEQLLNYTASDDGSEQDYKNEL